MSRILDAQVPSQRWPLPEDSKWDIYYNDFETWLNKEYDMKTQSVAGLTMTWDEACESEELFDVFIEMWTDTSP